MYDKISKSQANVHQFTVQENFYYNNEVWIVSFFSRDLDLISHTEGLLVAGNSLQVNISLHSRMDGETYGHTQI